MAELTAESARANAAAGDAANHNAEQPVQHLLGVVSREQLQSWAKGPVQVSAPMESENEAVIKRLTVGHLHELSKELDGISDKGNKGKQGAVLLAWLAHLGVPLNLALVESLKTQDYCLLLSRFKDKLYKARRRRPDPAFPVAVDAVPTYMRPVAAPVAHAASSPIDSPPADRRRNSWKSSRRNLASSAWLDARMRSGRQRLSGERQRLRRVRQRPSDAWLWPSSEHWRPSGSRQLRLKAGRGCRELLFV